MKYRGYIWKRRIEDVFIFPFVLLGRVIALLFPLKKEYETFFFFPFYHTGGAEKVHALIAKATGNRNCIIFFTRKSVDNNFYHAFVQSGCDIRDISKYTDNKLFYFANLVYRGIISAHINRQAVRPVVFNGQCNFAYKLSPWLKKDISQVELIHSFNTFSWIRLPFLPFITQTVMISAVRVQDHLQQYKRLEVPQQFEQKIRHIVNGIELPEHATPKHLSRTLNLLYVGRGTEEKRVHIVAKIAKACAGKQLPVSVSILGDVTGAIPNELLPYYQLLGSTSSPTEIAAVYQKAHALAITSNTEGFPMVIEEAMAYGCVILATPVGDIPLHIKQKNGFVFSTIEDENEIVNEAVAYIEHLLASPEQFHSISDNNIWYARATFGIDQFNQEYQSLIAQLRASN